MTAKEIIDALLKLAEILTGWQVIAFAVILLFRRQLSPVIQELIRRVTKAPGGWEFAALQEVREGMASLVNQNEIVQDQAKLNIKVDPKSIRIKHSNRRLDEKWWDVDVWIDAPTEFLDQVEKVTYERHPTFHERFIEVVTAPFKDAFRCWGEFTIKASIKLRDGQVLRRQRYLTLDVD